jgi:hypothetical protein
VDDLQVEHEHAPTCHVLEITGGYSSAIESLTTWFLWASLGCHDDLAPTSPEMMVKVRGIISRIIAKRPYYPISGWWVTNFLDRSEEFSWVIARFSWGYLRWTTSFLNLQCILPCSSATILYFPSCRISCYLLRCLIYQWWLVKTNVALQCSLFSMGIPGS